MVNQTGCIRLKAQEARTGPYQTRSQKTYLQKNLIVTVKLQTKKKKGIVTVKLVKKINCHGKYIILSNKNEMKTLIYQPTPNSPSRHFSLIFISPTARNNRQRKIKRDRVVTNSDGEAEKTAGTTFKFR